MIFYSYILYKNINLTNYKLQNLTHNVKTSPLPEITGT